MYSRLLLVSVVLASLAGCVRVKATERGRLADPAMASPWERTVLGSEYAAKLVEVKTGGAKAGVAPGGGCGCTQ